MIPDPEAVLRGVKALGLALDVLDAATRAVTADLASGQVRRVVDDMDAEELRMALTVLAVDAVWRMPLPPEPVRTAEQVWDRQRELQSWVWRRRRDASRARAQAKRTLERARQAQQAPGPRGPRGGA